MYSKSEYFIKPMEIRQIQYFLSVVDTGSFSEAADEFYISQSSLSKNIIALEKEIGVLLFDRSKRKVSLTNAGEAFQEHARKINATYKALLVDLDGFKSEGETFSVAAIPVITQYGITTYIGQFKEVYPTIDFTLDEIDGLNILLGLEEHRYDLAFTRHHLLDHNKFSNLEISKDKLLVVVSTKNRHANRSSISIKELKDDNFIIFDKVTDLNELIIDVCRKAGFEPTIFYSSHRKVSVFSLVGANIGIALMPSKIFDYHKNPEVLAIPLAEDIECNMVLVYAKDHKIPKSAQIFIDFIKAASK
jgi:LysR family transcriptional regulator, transcription activator of glutamate synthase operon